MQNNQWTRRQFLRQASIAASGIAVAPHSRGQSPNNPLVASGPFQPTYDSLRSQYKTPDWFRDAKFGIWNHWTAQSVPEQGDWYARNMYLQGQKQYDHHLKTYGHPSKVGWMEMNNLWKAERWEPERLMDLYAAAGAKYFATLANHHDNFDTYNSRYHSWNATRVGPKKDIVGTYTKIARERGLRVAVTNHSGHAWHWLQTAYDYDPEGSLAGTRYDAYILTKADGRGKWWDGLDPQELYTGRNIVMPDGIMTTTAADAWHQSHDRIWNEAAPPMNPSFAKNWFLRCQDLMDTYKPDLVYYDDTELPMGQYGLDVVAHYYNSCIRDKGKLDVVVNAKHVKPEHEGAFTLDIERGKAEGIQALPWQTDTCIGHWHYDLDTFQNHQYKTAKVVIHSLIDIVSKNGNLMLSIPLKGDGTIDSDEFAFLQAIATWIPLHGEAIYGTRPFAVFGEGPPDILTGKMNEKSQRAFTAEDIRFTQKSDVLYAFALGWPTGGKLTIKTLSRGATVFPKLIQQVTLIGAGRLTFVQDAAGLTLNLPEKAPNEYAYAFVIRT